jgi:type I restriction enzyme S subunit
MGADWPYKSAKGFRVHKPSDNCIAAQGADAWEPYFVLKALQALRHKWADYAVSTRKDPNITKSDIAAFLLPRMGIAEQTEWASKFRSIDSVIADELAGARKLNLQKKGLMLDLLANQDNQ